MIIKIDFSNWMKTIFIIALTKFSAVQIFLIDIYFANFVYRFIIIKIESLITFLWLLKNKSMIKFMIQFLRKSSDMNKKFKNSYNLCFIDLIFWHVMQNSIYSLTFLLILIQKYFFSSNQKFYYNQNCWYNSIFISMACDLRLGKRTAQMYVLIDRASSGHVIHKSEHIKDFVISIFKNRIFMKKRIWHDCYAC